MKITLLEDDQAQADLLKEWLTAEGFTVSHHENCALLLANINKDLPDIVILDWEYAAIGNPWFDASCLSRYLSMPSDDIYQLHIFKNLDEATFKNGLGQADRMTEILQRLWYWARE